MFSLNVLRSPAGLAAVWLAMVIASASVAWSMIDRVGRAVSIEVTGLPSASLSAESPGVTPSTIVTDSPSTTEPPSPTSTTVPPVIPPVVDPTNTSPFVVTTTPAPTTTAPASTTPASTTPPSATPTPRPTQTEPSEQPDPTVTVTPSATPTFSWTPQPTFTPTGEPTTPWSPTWTPTPTPTDSESETPTPTPTPTETDYNRPLLNVKGECVGEDGRRVHITEVEWIQEADAAVFDWVVDPSVATTAQSTVTNAQVKIFKKGETKTPFRVGNFSCASGEFKQN